MAEPGEFVPVLRIGDDTLLWDAPGPRLIEERQRHVRLRLVRDRSRHAGVLSRMRVTHVHNPAYQIRNNYGITLSRRLAAAIGKRLVARCATHITGTLRQIITDYGLDTRRFHRAPKGTLHCGFNPVRFREDVNLFRACVRREWG